MSYRGATLLLFAIDQSKKRFYVYLPLLLIGSSDIYSIQILKGKKSDILNTYGKANL